MTKVAVLGAGGHSRSVIALLRQNNIEISGLYDDGFKGPETILGLNLLGSPDDISKTDKIVLAIGDNTKREENFRKFRAQILNDNLRHPSVLFEQIVECGQANSFFAKCYVNNGVRIGDNNLINTGAILEHEVVVGSHNHISVGATLLGRAKIGDFCFLGAGSVVRDRVSICSGVIVGANSFVAENISVPGTYVGSPARKIS